MQNITPIEFNLHKDLKILPNPGFDHAAKLHMVALTVKEYDPAAANYPILFVKDENTGQFRSIALLGLEAGENCFYNGGNWQATHIPMNVARHPFLIAPKEGDDIQDQLYVCLENDSDYLSKKDGDALYHENGEETDFLKSVKIRTSELFDNEVITQVFISKLVEMKLLRSIRFHLDFEDGDKRSLSGLYVIDEECFRQLEDKTVCELFRAGYLTAIQSIIVSLGQINRLVKLHNQSGKTQIHKLQPVFDSEIV